MYTYQQRMYAKRLYKLRQAYIVKDNIHLTYKYKNRNKAFHNIDTMQDRINKAIIEDKINGNGTHPKNLKKHGKEIIHATITNERKRIHHDKHNKSVNHATKINSEIFTDIFNYRRQKISESLEDKIDKELKRPKYQELSDSEKISKLRNDYQNYGKKRLQNIIKDAMHTNESNIAFINAIEKGYNYKIWMNGRSKGKTRPWHKAKHIASVPIDETFDIYGSYPARMMYPGDLNGGAENVANCKCWLNYTNRVPKTLRKKSTFNVHPNLQQLFNKQPVNKLRSTVKKPINKIKKTIKQIGNKVTSRIKVPKRSSKNIINKDVKFKKDVNKSVTINGKTAYGVGESPKDKLAFEEKYGIKENELTKEEINFIKLYSGAGFSLLNRYMREIVTSSNPKLLKRKYAIKWLKLWFKYPKQFITFDESLKIMETLFEKGKILEENLVVVRRQKKPMTEYVEEGIYHSDSCLSTSISENVKPEEYGAYVHYIVIPKGTKILYIEGITSIKREYEILLDKNIDLRFVGHESQFKSYWELL